MTDPRSEPYAGRLTEQYLTHQLNTFRTAESFLSWKKRINDYDTLYKGDFKSLFPNEVGLTSEPLVENKLKNATHDLARLATDAVGTPVFLREKEGDAAAKKASIRAVIAETLWKMGGGTRLERKLYIDLIATGAAALSVYYNDKSPYPQLQRLDPRFIFPDYVNGRLQTLLYVESMKERQAARLFPDIGLKADAKDQNQRDVYISTYFDETEVVQFISRDGAKSGIAERSDIVSRWQHDLGCIPVAFASLDSADGTYHGLLDQLGGPLMVRNKTVRLLTNYLESMVHTPFEAKNIMNADDEPGPLTIYQHDPNSDDSFMRRVAPATPANGVFGLLQLMNEEQAAEAIQPPARVGIVQQSIASGSFVNSTQGTLSSVIKELQALMSQLRVDSNYICFKIERRYQDKEKPLARSIQNKTTYVPSEDMGDWQHHTIEYGAAAGLNRTEADQRILQHFGAGLIDPDTAREQIDYVDDVSIIQTRIDRHEMAKVLFQRFAGDPRTPVSVVSKAVMELGKGKTLTEVVEKLLPEIEKAEQEALAAQQAAAGGPGPTDSAGGEVSAAPTPEEEAATLAGGGSLVEGLRLRPDPIQQQIVRNPY